MIYYIITQIIIWPINFIQSEYMWVGKENENISIDDVIIICAKTFIYIEPKISDKNKMTENAEKRWRVKNSNRALN